MMPSIRIVPDSILLNVSFDTLFGLCGKRPYIEENLLCSCEVITQGSLGNKVIEYHVIVAHFRFLAA